MNWAYKAKEEDNREACDWELLYLCVLFYPIYTYIYEDVLDVDHFKGEDGQVQERPEPNV